MSSNSLLALTDFAKWTERSALQAALLNTGIGIWLDYQSEVKANCEDPDGLERYWDEVAKEYVSAAGKATPERRQFNLSGTYRSQYLDELAGSHTPRPDDRRARPLHSCARAHEERIVGVQGFGLALTSKLEALKLAEINEQFVDTENPDCIPAIRDVLFKSGATESRKNLFKKPCPGTDLLLSCRIDVNGSKPFESDLYCYILDKKNDLAFEISDLSPIVPGMGYYAIGKSKRAAIWDLYCRTKAFICFSNSFLSEPLNIDEPNCC